MDEPTLVREGLCLLLHKIPGVTIAAVLDEIDSLKDVLVRQQTDYIIVNISLPGLDIADLINHIKHDSPASKIIVIGDKIDIPLAVKLNNLRIHGCLSYNCNQIELEQSICNLANNQGSITPPSKYNLRNGRSNTYQLSRREREIFMLLVEGMNTKQIALYHGISVKTVETHRQHLMLKTKSRNIVDLIKLAINEKYISNNCNE